MQKREIEEQTVRGEEGVVALPRTIHLVPMDHIDGFDVRPGFYEINGATAIPGGVNFTVYSHGAASIELLLFRREEETPYAVLPFPVFARTEGADVGTALQVLPNGGADSAGTLCISSHKSPPPNALPISPPSRQSAID